MTARHNDSGVALINVLLVMAVAAALVQSMLSAQERAIALAQNASDRVQSFALAKGGVSALRSALRQDLLTAPESDHFGEAWAGVVQEEVSFDFGSYSVVINDAQGRFDLNVLTRNAIAQQRVFSALLAAVDLPGDLLGQITDVVIEQGPLISYHQLHEHGISDTALHVLEPYVTTLGTPGAINLNTAPEPVLEALFSSAIVARALSARRANQGFLTRADLSDLGVLQPGLAGWRSDTYDIVVNATVGDVTVSYGRRMLRDPDSGTVIDQPIMRSETK